MTTAVSRPSMARSMRNQVEAGNRRSACAGTSIRSIATSVHTPDWTTKFSDLIARSITRSTNVPGPLTARTPGSQAGSMATAVFDTAWPRTHSRRGSTRPQAAAVGGSKRSKVSIRATVSPRRVAAANAAHTSPVRPDEAGPTTSDTCPRGKPPASPRSRASTSSGETASSPRRSGMAEVRVRSRFRSRSRASTVARTAISHLYSLNFCHCSE